MTSSALPEIGEFTAPDLPPNACLTMRQFAAAVGMNYDAVARGVRAGELPAHKICGAIRIFWGEAMEKTDTVQKWRRK